MDEDIFVSLKISLTVIRHKPMEIVSTQKQRGRLLYYAALGPFLLAGFLINEKVVQIIFVLLFLFLAFLIAMDCDTIALRLRGDQIEVDYIRFFRRRRVCFNIADTVLEVRQHQEATTYKSFREGRRYFVLHILQQGKTRYYADGRDGFEPEAFMQFLNAFAAARVAG
ncbi:hypothetical protein [Chitinophaga flava]|uniref:Uncharacterized protein n=1 Tax=Chitinophaga flava TaxID=2259036 RepID=A0A365Y290_9BACT|nr:hypothetical protein [Chitinophaga flava]RBL92054.1 hypothetical protein DF182_05525 [Chitinophaga flava]